MSLKINGFLPWEIVNFTVFPFLSDFDLSEADSSHSSGVAKSCSVLQQICLICRRTCQSFGRKKNGYRSKPWTSHHKPRINFPKNSCSLWMSIGFKWFYHVLTHSSSILFPSSQRRRLTLLGSPSSLCPPLGSPEGPSKSLPPLDGGTEMLSTSWNYPKYLFIYLFLFILIY